MNDSENLTNLVTLIESSFMCKNIFYFYMEDLDLSALELINNAILNCMLISF